MVAMVTSERIDIVTVMQTNKLDYRPQGKVMFSECVFLSNGGGLRVKGGLHVKGGLNTHPPQSS